MRYVCRDGIVLTKICNIWLLIPTRKASEEAPLLMPLSFPALIVWTILQRGQPIEDSYRALSILTHKSTEELREPVDEILQMFLKKNLILAEED